MQTKYLFEPCKTLLLYETEVKNGVNCILEAGRDRKGKTFLNIS